MTHCLHFTRRDTFITSYDGVGPVLQAMWPLMFVMSSQLAKACVHVAGASATQYEQRQHFSSGAAVLMAGITPEQVCWKLPRSMGAQPA